MMFAVLAFGFLILCCAWALFARVPVYVKADATVGPRSDVQKIRAVEDGQIVEKPVKLGQRVKEGDVIVRLDDALASDKLRGAELLLQTQEDRRRLIDERIVSLERAIAKIAASERHSQRELQSLAKEKEVLADASNVRLGRLKSLQADGAQVSSFELEAAEREAETNKLVADAFSARMKNRAEIGQLTENMRQEVWTQREEQRALQGQIASQTVEISELKERIEYHIVRSPVDGLITELTAGAVGTSLERGDVVVAIEPVRSDVVFGTVEAGQSAKLRPNQMGWLELSGYPAFRFSRIKCKIVSVLRSVDEATVAVEMVVDDKQEVKAPMPHGARGVVYLEVERVSPVTFLLQRL